MSESALSLLNRAIYQRRRLSVDDLRLVRRDFFRMKLDMGTWRFRAINQARWRMRVAKEKNRIVAVYRRLIKLVAETIESLDNENDDLKQRADKNFADWLEVSEDRHLWKTSHGRVVQDNEELITAIHRLPEPPVGFGDGPDERVGWILEQLAHYRDRKPSYGKVVQDLTILEMKNNELEDEIWCLRGEAGKVAFLDASFDIKQRLVVAEANLAALRERAERVQEGEPWDLLDFVLKKTAVHASECLKNTAFEDCVCTCGAEKN